MPLLTIQDLKELTPIFHRKMGHVLGRSAMSLLSVDKINELYDHHSHLHGADFAHSVLEALDIKYTIYAETPEVITQSNALRHGTSFITISNHPYGSIDGIILADYFGYLCPNYKILANKIWERVEALSSSFIPIAPTESIHTTLTMESILGIRRALTQLRSGGSLGIFPSGAVSDLNLRDLSIRDRKWQLSIIRFIAKAGVPILPVRFFEGNSLFYYLLGLINWRVRLLRLPAEIFNKSHHPIPLGIGQLVSVEQQQAYLASHSIEEFGLWLRNKIYEMSIDRYK